MEGDSMTIEFLRGRLLAERSVSKAARQRAHDLETRVFQLQDQLTLISTQRENAERATSHLLSILEINSNAPLLLLLLLSDDDAFDSDYGSELSSTNKEDDRQPSVNLSWITRKDATAIEKRDIRKQTSFSSIRSHSPKYHSGKSCRKIRRRETRSPEEAVNPVLDSQTNAETSSEMACSLRPNDHGKNKEMERALELQAQLIGRYEEEEKAQRDWEDKFRETNSSTQDTNERGNQSDITEEIDGAQIASDNEKVEKVIFDDDSVPSEEGIAKEKQSELYSHHPTSHNHRHHSKGKLDSLLKPWAPLMSSSGSNSFSLRSENERNGIVVYPPGLDIGGVLEALKAAKSSIDQRLGTFPPSVEGVSSYSMPPVGCGSLFRIPSDTKKSSSLQDSSVGVNLASSHPADKEGYVMQTTGGGTRFAPSLPPYMESRSNVLSSDGFMGSPYGERVWKANGNHDKYPCSVSGFQRLER